MSKCFAVVTAFLVPVLVVSAAGAAGPTGPTKKKKPKGATPAVTVVVAPPGPPRDFEAEARANAESIRRVEASIAGYTPKDAPPPTITHGGNEVRAPGTTSGTTSSTTLTFAVTPGTSASRARADADVANARAARHEGLNDGVSIAPLADYGTSNVYGVGIGVRIGYTFTSRLYVGGTVVHHFGGSNDLLAYSSSYLGPEVGYNLPLGPIVLRPYVGGGVGYLQTTYHGTGLIPGGGGTGVPVDFTGHSRSVFFWPGVTFFLPVGDDFAIGADARALLAPGLDTSTGTLPNDGALQFASVGTTKPASTALSAGLTASYRF